MSWYKTHGIGDEDTRSLFLSVVYEVLERDGGADLLGAARRQA